MKLTSPQLTPAPTFGAKITLNYNLFDPNLTQTDLVDLSQYRDQMNTEVTKIKDDKDPIHAVATLGMARLETQENGRQVFHKPDEQSFKDFIFKTVIPAMKTMASTLVSAEEKEQAEEAAIQQLLNNMKPATTGNYTITQQAEDTTNVLGANKGFSVTSVKVRVNDRPFEVIKAVKKVDDNTETINYILRVLDEDGEWTNAQSDLALIGKKKPGEFATTSLMFCNLGTHKANVDLTTKIKYAMHVGDTNAVSSTISLNNEVLSFFKKLDTEDNIFELS